MEDFGKTFLQQAKARETSCLISSIVHRFFSGKNHVVFINGVKESLH